MRGSHQSAPLRLIGLLAAWLAHMSDSLVSVSRRAEWALPHFPASKDTMRNNFTIDTIHDPNTALSFTWIAVLVQFKLKYSIVKLLCIVRP